MKIVKQDIFRVISLLLTGVMLLLIVNSAVFLHVHKLENGIVVVHAHPFDKSADSAPIKKHHHKNFQYLFLQQLNLLFFVALAIIVLLSSAVKAYEYNETRVCHYLSGFISPKLGRAPPCL